MSIGYQPVTKSNNKSFALIVVGAFVLLIVAGIIYLISTPDVGVKMANEMEPYATQYIKSHNLLNQDEKIIAYYDATRTCNGTEAAILTNKNLKYHKNGKTTTFPLNSIRDIFHSYSKIDGDIIGVENNEGQFMKIEIAVFNGGKIFYKALQRRWEGSREKAQRENNIEANL